MASTKKPKQLTDVATPGDGKIKASSTSRQIIIKHQNVQDPMVMPEGAKSNLDVAVKATSPNAKKMVISPIHSDVVATADDDVISPPQEPKPLPPEPAEVPTPPEEQVEATVPFGVAEPVQDQTDTVDKLVADETYFLDITTREQRRSKRSALIGTIVIVVLVAAWHNVALDANLLPNIYNIPHTSFFSAK